MTQRLLDRAMVVNAAAGVFGIGGVVASLKRRPLLTHLCTLPEVSLMLVYWRLMSEYHEAHRNDAG